MIRSILQNEKYAGNALLQKEFTTDFLTKSRKKNEGEVRQFFVENSHPAIIAPDEWEAVQAEIERRARLGRPMGCGSPFSARIICGCCNGYFGPKVWGSNTKYRRVIWRCNDKYKTNDHCESTHITEDDIKSKFLEAWNSLSANREAVLADCKAAKKALCDCSTLESEMTELRREIEVVEELSRKAIYENAHTAMNQEEFSERSNGYFERRNHAAERIAEIEKEITRRRNTARLLEKFIRDMKNSPLTLDEFDEKLWAVAIDSVTVYHGRLVFRFRDGSEVET